MFVEDGLKITGVDIAGVLSRLLKRDAEPQFAGAVDAESAESGEQKLFHQLHAAELYRGD